MVFNQNHASILHFIFSSSIIIIVGLPTGLWLMQHMLYANDPITYASTENSEGFMIVRTPKRGTSVGVRGLSGDGLPSKDNEDQS